MSKFIVHKINISKFYGENFENTQVNNLSAGINIVLGPNSSGKSTIARGISHLISPTLFNKRRIEAKISYGGKESVVVSLVRKEDFNWPGSVRPDLYRLEIGQLLEKPDKLDQSAIISALEGGVDLNSLPTSWSPLAKINNIAVPVQRDQEDNRRLAINERSLPELRSQLQSLTETVRDLDQVEILAERVALRTNRQEKEKNIESLEEKYPGIDKQSENAADEANKKFQAVSDAEANYKKDEQSLELYGGPAKEQLSLEDQQKLDKLIQENERINKERDVQSELLDGAKDDLVKLGVDPGRKDFQIAETSLTEDESTAQEDNDHNSFEEPTDEDILTARDLDREISEANRILQLRKEEYKGAAEKLRDARTELAIEENPDAIEIPAKEILNQLIEDPSIASLADDVRKYDAHKALHGKVEDWQQAWLNQHENDTVVRDAELAVQKLRDWLESQSETPTHQSAEPQWLPLALSIGLFAIGIFVVNCSVSKSIPNLWVAGAVIVLGLLAFVYSLFRLRKEKPSVTSTTNPWERHQRDTPEYFKPKNWTVPEVCSILAEATKTKATADGWDAVINDTKLDAADDSKSKKQKLEDRKQTFKEATGIDEIDPYLLAALVQKLLRLHQLEDDFKQAKSRVDSASTDLENRKKELKTLLNNRASTGQELSYLRDAWRTYRGKRSRYDDLIKKQNEFREQANQLQEKYDAPEWDDPLEMLEKFAEWFKLTDTFNQQKKTFNDQTEIVAKYLNNQGAPANEDLESRVNEISLRHDTATLYRELNLELILARADERAVSPNEESITRQKLSFESTIDQINAVIENLKPLRESKEKKHGDIRDIEISVNQAKRSRENEDYRRNVAEFKTQVSRFIKTTARNTVLDYIRTAVKIEDMPKIITNANVWLELFTSGSFGGLDIENKSLVVTDKKTEKHKKFEELSGGTKVHVALAIRLAAIETSEAETKFPLLLDESLATSDDINTSNILKIINDIMKGQENVEGRQIIFFTNKKAETMRLKTAFEKLGSEATIIELSAGMKG